MAELIGRHKEWTVWVLASSPHAVRAVIHEGDGTVVRALYAGTADDSLRIIWDGTDNAGVLLATGTYRLVVASLDEARRVEREYHVPLRVHTTAPDTLLHPGLPPRRPERGTAMAMVESLAGGLALGVALWLVPPLVAHEPGAAPLRLYLAGGIGLSGVIGAIVQRPGRTLGRNVAWNRQVSDAWERQRSAIVALNVTRRAEARMLVTAGAPGVVEVRSP